MIAVLFARNDSLYKQLNGYDVGDVKASSSQAYHVTDFEAVGQVRVTRVKSHQSNRKVTVPVPAKLA